MPFGYQYTKLCERKKWPHGACLICIFQKLFSRQNRNTAGQQQQISPCTRA